MSHTPDRQATNRQSNEEKVLKAYNVQSVPKPNYNLQFQNARDTDRDAHNMK